jgi:predicted N-acetyltransferase YhbS
MITYRTMMPNDIAEGIKLCRKAKWNQLEAEWQVFLKLSPEACMVATDHNQVVGTVTTIRYQDSFSWIGMVLVDPEYRRQGIGHQLLLRRSPANFANEETVKLDATPAGPRDLSEIEFCG